MSILAAALFKIEAMWSKIFVEMNNWGMWGFLPRFQSFKKGLERCVADGLSIGEHTVKMLLTMNLHDICDL
jgi:hypothetical protein